jgi:hypothetical protein
MWMAASTNDPGVLPAVFEACTRVPYMFMFDTEVADTHIRLDEFGPAGYDRAADALKSKNTMVRRVATQLLTYSTQAKLTRKAQGALLRARHDADPYVAVYSTYFAIWLGPGDYLRMLPFTHHPNRKFMVTALEAAARAMPSKAKALRIDHLDDDGASTFAMNNIRYTMKRSDYPAVARVLARAQGPARLNVIKALGYVKNEKAIPALTALTSDPDPKISAAAIGAIGMIRDRR